MSSAQAEAPKALPPATSPSAASGNGGDARRHDFFQRAAETLHREVPASEVRPSHGESEFGRFQVPSGTLGGYESGGSTDYTTPAPLESPSIDDTAEERTARAAPTPRQRPRPLWQPSFVETLVPTQSRRSAPNNWSYPETGSYGGRGYDSGETLETGQFEALPERGVVVSDEAPGAYAGSELDPSPLQDREQSSWMVFGRGEEYQQDPWGARYPSPRYRGPSIPSRYGRVMQEVRHRQPSRVRSEPFYDVRNPAGPYVYEYENIDDPFEDFDEATALGETRFRVQAGLPPLRQWYDPNMAHFKAGSLYLEALWAETGFLYSDFRGTRQFAEGEEDGWLGFASFAMRGAGRVFKDAFLVLNGEVVYLFGENRLGFRAMDNLIGPTAIAQLDYTAEWGEWDVRIFDRVGTGRFFNLNFLVQEDAFERAGRYTFGFPGNGRSRDFLITDPVVYNQIGIQGQRDIGEMWRTQLSYTHTDFFSREWFSSHRHREVIQASIGARPRQVLFNPALSYNGISTDHFESMGHALYLSGRGALTERLLLDARTGYLWNDLGNNNLSQSDRWLWSMRLRHRISSRSFHYVSFGQDFYWQDFTDDSAFSEFIKYGFSHRFSNHVFFNAFIQRSHDEFLTGEFTNRKFDHTTIGARLDFQVTDDFFFFLTYRFQQMDETRTLAESDRHILNATAFLRLTERSVSYVGYQFEKLDASRSFFDEHLFRTGVRRYF